MYQDFAKQSALTDKDCQLISRTYRKLFDLYYENSNNTQCLEDLTKLSCMLPSIIHTIQQSKALSLLSSLQILKAKVKPKNINTLNTALENAIKHLNLPSPKQLNGSLLMQLIESRDLFEVGCLIVVRFKEPALHGIGFQDSKAIQLVSQNASISPILAVELLQELCSSNQGNCVIVGRSGVVRWLLMDYLPSHMQDKNSLYNCLKLLKKITENTKVKLRDRQKHLGNVILLYDDYIPIMTQICDRCYDEEQCSKIIGKNHINSLDQAFLWSYCQKFCVKNLTIDYIKMLTQHLNKNKLESAMQTKIYAILANYCSFIKQLDGNFLKILPKNQDSLLNYLKMALTLNENQIGTQIKGLIDWKTLQKLVQSSVSSKVALLYKMLSSSVNKEGEKNIGTLRGSVYGTGINFDLLNQTARRVPQNKNHFLQLANVFKEKAGTNESEKDTLLMLKEKALASLNTAIINKKQFDLNILLQNFQLQSVLLIAKLLQILELYLTMHEQAIDDINVELVLALIKWLQDNYEGQEVDWGSIGQLLIILYGQKQWKQQLNNIKKETFWLLAAPQAQEKSDNLIYDAVKNVANSASDREVAFLLGFMGFSIGNSTKRKVINQNRALIQRVITNIKSGNHYKLSLVMLALFIKNWWESEQEQGWKQNNKVFQDILGSIVKAVISNFRELPQQYTLLGRCLPYALPTDNLCNHIELLIPHQGKLAAYLCQQQKKQGKRPLALNKMPSISVLPTSSIIQMLVFLKENPSYVQSSQINSLLHLLASNKNSYWAFYPLYMDIFFLLIDLLSLIPQQIKPILTQIITRLLEQIQQNKDITQDERAELYEGMRDALQELKEQGAYIQIQRVRTVVRRIKEQQIRQEIIVVLKDYQIKQKAIQQNIKSITQSKNNQSQYVSVNKNGKKEIQVVKESVVGPTSSSVSKEEPNSAQQVPIQKQFETIKNKSSANFMQALFLLKNIVSKQLPPSRFAQIYPIFSQASLSEQQKELLGNLLAKFYNIEQNDSALKLLLDKDRTILGKEAVYELVEKHIPAFVLARRWKLHSLQALALAMQRIEQGWIADGCQVAQYNIVNSEELEYFYSQKFHLQVPPLLTKINQQDQIAKYLALIGSSAKLASIRDQYISNKLHIKILPFARKFPNSVKVIGNLCYALSSLCFQKESVCAQVVDHPAQIQIIFTLMLIQKTTKTIIQPGVCFIANVSYSTLQIKQKLRKRKIIQLLLAIFEANLSKAESSTFKQLVRALGNLSLSKQCCQQMIDRNFYALAARMSEELDILVRHDQNRSRLARLLLDLITNLASTIPVQPKQLQKIPLLLITLLQTSQRQSQLLVSCIDAIDTLSRNAQIQAYFVIQKRLPLIMLDVLKIQQDIKVMVKSMRLLSNLCLHASCTAHVLKSNVLSVVANVVLPHMRGGSLHQQQANKIQNYTIKSIMRVYQTKPDLQQILKSGFLDCVVRLVQTVVVEDSFLDILFAYASHLPTFLNKRTFSCLIKILAERSSNKNIVDKCIKGFRDMVSFAYDRTDQRQVLQGVPQMYMQFLKSQYTADVLFLLAYHLLRSYKLRRLLQKETAVLSLIKELAATEQCYVDISKEISFLIYNPPFPMVNPQINQIDFFSSLNKGIKCLLYRSDGSHKEAIIDIDQQYSLRVYKYPQGEIKNKYTMNLRHIRDFQMNYQLCKEDIWTYSGFSLQKSFFDSHQPSPICCCTIIGSSRWGQLKFINIQFMNPQDKMVFQGALRQLMNVFSQ